MDETWDGRIAAFWAGTDGRDPESLLAAMTDLVRERPESDPAALYELASVHDFLGHESEAIPLYQAALDGGLYGERRPQAVIQLASSLRNVGRAPEAVSLLQDFPEDPTTGAASQAFLALALFDAGRSREALQVALAALAPTLPLYSRSMAAYADELEEPGTQGCQ
ncbi:tetratricopeptide repeat protein [Arthrobacter woluwensis]|uniref:tetratricopeptide repeat protein n=1 Tax=Arthrobacter woluwensis TaxID=156980 RepID=UPI0011A5B6E7|nr:tetratricopeptide repeat protein [Arthrobacter woluwensis]